MSCRHIERTMVNSFGAAEPTWVCDECGKVMGSPDCEDAPVDPMETVVGLMGEMRDLLAAIALRVGAVTENDLKIITSGEPA